MTGTFWKTEPRRINNTLNKGVDKLVPIVIRWHPKYSVWAPRLETSQSKGFIDTPKCLKACMRRDWNATSNSVSFKNVLKKTLGYISEKELNDLKKASVDAYSWALKPFEFYSATDTWPRRSPRWRRKSPSRRRRRSRWRSRVPT